MEIEAYRIGLTLEQFYGLDYPQFIACIMGHNKSITDALKINAVLAYNIGYTVRDKKPTLNKIMPDDEGGVTGRRRSREENKAILERLKKYKKLFDEEERIKNGVNP